MFTTDNTIMGLTMFTILGWQDLWIQKHRHGGLPGFHYVSLKHKDTFLLNLFVILFDI